MPKDPPRANFDEMVRNLYRSCAEYLRDEGVVPEAALIKAARRVVWAMYVRREDGWDLLKSAVGDLAGIVGEPADETDI